VSAAGWLGLGEGWAELGALLGWEPGAPGGVGTGRRRQRSTAALSRQLRNQRRNNENLARLSRKIISPVIFAHVRAAYPGMPVSEQNCHPFQWGRYLWMHNGVVGGFTQVRRRAGALASGRAGRGGGGGAGERASREGRRCRG
jgi:hypothetical protein